VLPFNRIVAYYGNFYSTGMGVLGQYPVPQMLAKLASTTAEWKAADPSTPVIPAIDYIAVTAQGSAGADGKYRARMPDSQLDKAVDLANQVHGIVILDVQGGPEHGAGRNSAAREVSRDAERASRPRPGVRYAQRREAGQRHRHDGRA